MTARYQIHYAPRACAELMEIYQYIAKDSPDHAMGMTEQILKAVEGLETFPHRQVVHDQSKRLTFPVRSLPVGPYVIFFRVNEQKAVVEILRIRHGSRRPLKRY